MSGQFDKLSDATLGRIAVYQAVFDRYNDTPDPEAAVLLATRLLINRRGYSQVLRNLQHHGVEWMAENVVAEFNEMFDFMSELLASNAGDDKERQGVSEDMAALQVDMDSAEGRAYLHKLLERLQRRAAWWFTTPAQDRVH